MVLCSMTYDDLVVAAYDGIFETPLWARFLEGLREAAGAHYAGLMFRPADRPFSEAIELSAGRRAPPDIQRIYVENFQGLDPFRDVQLQLADDHVYALREMLRDENPEHRAFLDKIMLPGGLEYMRLVRVTEASGTSAWLSFARSGEDFGAEANALLLAISRHLKQALRMHLALERERQRAEIGIRAIERMNAGWISLDAQACIVEQSAEAQQIMADSGQLRVTHANQIAAADKGANQRLAHAIADIIANPNSRPHAVNISRDPWVDVLITRSNDPGTGTTRNPVVVMFVQGDQKSAADRQDQIAELFGLLPSEARLAFALSRGMSIVEAAEALNLTEGTARNYSKKIYEKMGARGQSDLVRFILTSVLALA